MTTVRSLLRTYSSRAETRTCRYQQIHHHHYYHQHHHVAAAHHRCFSSMQVFNRDVKRMQRDRAAIAADADTYEYLRDAVAARLIDRLSDITRVFPQAVDLGCHTGNINRLLPEGQSGIKTLLQLDMSMQMIHNSNKIQETASSSSSSSPSVISAVCDEEYLPLAPASCDLILSSLSLHWVNDLPSVFSSIRTALKPDGVFLAALFGGNTLQELRSAFSLADRERSNTLIPHLSPFVNGQDLGDLIASAGFSLPTIDTEAITVRYPDMFTLLHHLQGMGEQNASIHTQRPTSAATFLSAASIYQQLYEDEEGLIPATFQIYYIIGWAPHHSQPQPLRRGSAKHKLGDLNKWVQQKEKETEKEKEKAGSGQTAASVISPVKVPS